MVLIIDPLVASDDGGGLVGIQMPSTHLHVTLAQMDPMETKPFKVLFEIKQVNNIFFSRLFRSKNFN